MYICIFEQSSHYDFKNRSPRALKIFAKKCESHNTKEYVKNRSPSTKNGTANQQLVRALFEINMSHDMRFPTMWYVRPAKPQISLCIRAV